MPPGTYSVGDSPQAVGVADLNHDGIPDVVAVNYQSGNVSVLLGIGNGVFHVSVDYPDIGYESIAFADFNNDGNPDIATVGYSVSLLSGNGKGQFEHAPEYAIPRDGDAVSVQAADLNGDGNVDIVTANRHAQSYSIFLGKGNRRFEPAATKPLVFKPSGIVVASGDLILSSLAPPAVYVLPALGGGEFGWRSSIRCQRARTPSLRLISMETDDRT